MNSQNYGLSFNGQEYLLDDRTGLDITPDRLLKFKDNFEISFEVRLDFQQQLPLFGYVLRVINQGDKNIDLVVSNILDKKRKLNLVIGNAQSVTPLEEISFTSKNWVNLRIKFLLSENKLQLYVSDNKRITTDIDFSKKDSFKILFGANNYKKFATSDVPDMDIRDIKIYSEQRLQYHFPLNQCGGNETIDLIKKRKALTKNPEWLLCEHQEWHNDFSSEIPETVLSAFDEENGDVFILGNKELLIYQYESGKVKKVKYSNGPINLTLDHRAIYNGLDQKLYCYLADKDLISSLNIETGTWDNLDTFSEKEHKQVYQNHNSLFSHSSNSIFLLGGYGQYNYNNEIRTIDLNSGSWENLKTDDSIFNPRYLAGASIKNDTIYILGGYGSSSGDQLVNPKNYYDLLGYAIENETFFKKFDLPRLFEDMIVANSFFIDEDSRDFYALAFEKIKFDNKLQLVKGNLDKPSFEFVGGEIPFRFLDVKSFVNLYFLPKHNKIIAYTSYLNDSGVSEFSIHSIAYPPITKKIEPKPADKTDKSFFSCNICVFGLLAFLSVLGWLYYYYYYYRARKKSLLKKQQLVLKKEPEDTNLISENEPIDFSPISKMSDYQIIFFGGFQVIDDSQNDITNKFSPLLKELFLLIWLNTFKNDKGISSAKLVEILWYDKSPRRAQNNRSVNITKLRNILNDLSGCELTKDTGYWKIVHDYEKLKSDYYELIHITSDKMNISKERIDHIINITKKGTFLSNLNYEWLDGFKAQISEKVIDTLLSYAETVDIKKHPNFTIRLSDCVFNFDTINEEAMMYKCKAQYLMGKHSSAETSYKKFVKEYRILYDQEYEFSFTEVLDKV